MKKIIFNPKMPPRDFKLEVVSNKNWHPDLCSLYHFNTMALMTPLLELIVIRFTKNKQIQVEEEFKPSMNSLWLQEARHAAAYQDFAKQLIYPFYGKEFVSKVPWILRQIMRAPLYVQLAGLAFGEHASAVFSRQILQNPRLLEGVEPNIKALWLWHSQEELEHQSVSFDLQQKMRIKTPQKIFGAILYLLFFCSKYAYYLFKMMSRDQRSLTFMIKCLLRGLFVSPGFLAYSWKPLLCFFQRDFHPNKKNDAVLSDSIG
jgi:uncharacterized protein